MTASFSTSTLNDPHDGVWDFYSTEAKESGYNNPQVDKLINEGNALLDVEKRKPIYHQLYQVLAEDPPVILRLPPDSLGQQRQGIRF